VNGPEFDIIVVGGGHAGAEAAWAGANLGARVALVTLDPSKTGVMSCNPSIGGLAKGQIVREIDALGGLMGLAADATGINFKMLNASRGAAVRGPRCQCDKHAYAETVQQMLASRAQIEVIAGSVEEILVDHELHHHRVTGVVVELNGSTRIVRAPAVVLTTGTFMRALMHTGEAKTPGGRVGEGSAVGISGALQSLGFELGRLKTGTPPRLKRDTIDWEALEPQYGDEPPTPFSELSRASAMRDEPWRPALAQVDCRITSTTPEAHALIRENLHRAPMYNGQIGSAGPRYCPSIEDKVVRFADRESHHVFLEPESHRDDAIYANGVSTSLPQDVQIPLVRTMPGCERAEILKWGYAVEYDSVRPHQIDATCMTKLIDGLFLAGQINGTSGYEEAAAQGLLAGLNAVRFARGEEPVRLARDEAYIGVLMDDLVTKTPREPYRMFTSRAEHRLLLRADNAPERLTALGRRWGLVADDRWGAFERRREQIAYAQQLIDSIKVGADRLADVVKRPNYSVDELAKDLALHAQQSWSQGVLETALAERQYEGYIRRQQAEAKRQRTMEERTIPAHVDYTRVEGLRAEARHALTKFRPATFGQASRLEGVTPADLTILLVAAKR
jgi:tRNA uridine 5-carboxymethylaminomethyl modification enzyme